MFASLANVHIEVDWTSVISIKHAFKQHHQYVLCSEYYIYTYILYIYLYTYFWSFAIYCSVFWQHFFFICYHSDLLLLPWLLLVHFLDSRIDLFRYLMTSNSKQGHVIFSFGVRYVKLFIYINKSRNIVELKQKSLRIIGDIEIYTYENPTF